MSILLIKYMILKELQGSEETITSGTELINIPTLTLLKGLVLDENSQFVTYLHVLIMQCLSLPYYRDKSSTFPLLIILVTLFVFLRDPCRTSHNSPVHS